jgi:hypothetical protein
MQRYARSSLVKKFGFKPGMKVAVLAAPDDFEEKLRELPEGGTSTQGDPRDGVGRMVCAVAQGTRRGPEYQSRGYRNAAGYGLFIPNKRAVTGWTSINGCNGCRSCGWRFRMQGVRRGCRLVGVDVPGEESCAVILAAYRFDV